MDHDEARTLLNDERERLRRMVADGEAAVADQQDDDAATSDHAVEIRDRQMEESHLESARWQLEEIEAALARLDDGTYGISDVSGEPIPDERLRAVPWARRLVDEQDQAEREGRPAAVRNQPSRR
ncbi:MAG TPA: TraR/DksA C4-type zinc finger protein [Euzebyales bacterium]|nr:TraR/DksA C4-type zinc finger protein [Euzebyales bacterium]